MFVLCMFSVDYLARVYETLRNDLKSDTGKEYFLYYQATPIMLSHLKPTHKVFIKTNISVNFIGIFEDSDILFYNFVLYYFCLNTNYI